jgi:hypothetical protein
MSSDDVIMDMSFISNIYNNLYNIISQVIQKAMNDSYFERWVQLKTENAYLRLLLENQSSVQKTPQKKVQFALPHIPSSSAPVLPLIWPDSPV